MMRRNVVNASLDSKPAQLLLLSRGPLYGALQVPIEGSGGLGVGEAYNGGGMVLV